MSTGRAGKAANKRDVIVLNSAGFTFRISVYNFQVQKMWNNNIEGKNDVFASTYPKFPTHKQGKSNFQSLCNSYCKHAGPRSGQNTLKYSHMQFIAHILDKLICAITYEMG